MVFEVAAMAGWLRPPHAAVHVAFGNVLGTDRKMFKSRSGEPVRFVDLLDEADRAGDGVGRARRTPTCPRRSRPTSAGWSASAR